MKIDTKDFAAVFLKGKIDEYLEGIRQEYNAVSETCASLRKQLAEYNKAEEVASLAKQLNQAYTHSLCQLSDVEKKRLEKFKSYHYINCFNRGKNEYYDYRLQETGIGTIIVVTCPICKKYADITDVDSW